jgi:hypothetical protein
VVQPADYAIQPEESLAFCQLYAPGITQSQVSQVINVTGRIPLEIWTCLEFTGSIDTKLELYESEQKTEFAKGVIQYLEELGDHRDEAINTMMKIIIQSPDSLLEPLEFFDRKLIVEQKVGYLYKYSFINRLAQNVVWDCLLENPKYRDVVDANIDSIASTIFKSGRTNAAAKGLELEHYIILRSSLTKTFVVTVREFVFSVNELQIKRFSPSSLKSMERIGDTEKLLLVPSIENLPGFDFVVYDGPRKMAVFVQVTVESTAKTHTDKFTDAGRNPESRLVTWCALLVNALPEDTKLMQLYITSEETGVNNQLEYTAVNYKELARDYPACSDLQLTKPIS